MEIVVLNYSAYFSNLCWKLFQVSQHTVSAEPLCVEDATGGGDTDYFPTGGAARAKDERLGGRGERVPCHVCFLQQPREGGLIG